MKMKNFDKKSDSVSLLMRLTLRERLNLRQEQINRSAVQR